MIVSNESAAACPLTLTLAPGTCQNPALESTLWNSRLPENNLLFVPPRNSSEPCEASLNPKTDCEIAPCLVAVLKNGSCLRLEIAGKANPRSCQSCQHWQRLLMNALTPSVGSLPKDADIIVAGEKICPVTWIPATSTVSVKTGPSTELPSPYWILKFPSSFCPVDDWDGSNLRFCAQAASAQSTPGTHKSEEPAKNK